MYSCSRLEAFDVFCFGHILYEMSVGKPLYANNSTTNDIVSSSYNAGVTEDRGELPHQMPDSTSKKILH